MILSHREADADPVAHEAEGGVDHVVKRAERPCGEGGERRQPRRAGAVAIAVALTAALFGADLDHALIPPAMNPG
jgi:hypothetical protein